MPLNYQKIARELKQSLEEATGPSLKSYIQSISETLSKIRPSSKADQQRIEVAQQHIKEVRLRSRRLEEQVNTLQEQVTMLEETAEKNKTVIEANWTLYSLTGQTPKDVATKIKKSGLMIESKTVDKFLLQSSVTSDEWDAFKAAVELELET